MAHIYHIGIGSNLDDPAARVLEAMERLSSIGHVDRRSSLYRSAPWGHRDQPWFVNAVVRIVCARPANELLESTQALEASMGRQQTIRWGPRRVDLDILLWGDHAVETPDLTIPHPHLHERAFVLVPLIEIEGRDFCHPTRRGSLGSWLDALSGEERTSVVKLEGPADGPGS